jgi:hypothetical protein
MAIIGRQAKVDIHKAAILTTVGKRFNILELFAHFVVL